MPGWSFIRGEYTLTNFSLGGTSNLGSNKFYLYVGWSHSSKLQFPTCISAFYSLLTHSLFFPSSLSIVGFSTPMWTCHTSPMTTTTSSRVPSIRSTVPMTSLTRTFPKIVAYDISLYVYAVLFCLTHVFSLAHTHSIAGVPLTSFIIKSAQHTWHITSILPFHTIRHRLPPMQLRPIFPKFIYTTPRPSPRHCGEFARDAPR